MRDQYVGDVSDVLKFAFLRSLAATDRRLGIAWYYSPGDDGRPDGRHLEWRDEPAWRGLDSELCTGLLSIPARSVAALEGAPIWPCGTIFHHEPMPSRVDRPAWCERKRDTLQKADIVFLDPDNGVGAETKRHATYAEIRHLRRPGRAVAFITFPGRSMKHDKLMKQLHQRLIDEADAEKVVTLRTNVSVPTVVNGSLYVQRQRWFTIIDPDAQLLQRAQTFTAAIGAIPKVRAVLDCTS
ncbi:MAG: hypothetical protein CMI62_16630 [Parvibaculum sp.]|uniref:hypothetical protein n=1 Tax=Parvibaculum sp. TaxID=2024848 RepID=UPI000C5E537F|nr:hypothetical protein [Parvibaculum sp.]MAU62348.1 hypothetical protein [Parvibaculum sp.]